MLVSFLVSEKAFMRLKEKRDSIDPINFNYWPQPNYFSRKESNAIRIFSSANVGLIFIKIKLNFMCESKIRDLRIKFPVFLFVEKLLSSILSFKLN